MPLPAKFPKVQPAPSHPPILYEPLLSRLAQGQHLRETRVHDPKPETFFSISETNENVHADAAHKAIRLGKVEPVKDGLFGDSQTYRLARA
jgi:hypothetical protein